VLEVPIVARTRDALTKVLDRPQMATFDRTLDSLAGVLAGRRIWNVNSTPTGGGVAELLSTLLPYERGAGIDAHWLVVEGRDGFFDVTKRIHNYLHEDRGDGLELGVGERAIYDEALAPEIDAVRSVVHAGDAVILHDPQTAGLIPALKAHGAAVVWRCHIGVDRPGPLAQTARSFLLGDVQQADAVIFTRRSYIWDELERDRVSVMVPCIDVTSPKNEPMPDEDVRKILATAGIVGSNGAASHAFTRVDGSTGSVTRRAQVVEEEPAPEDAPMVLQVSRWDRLKDHHGVMRAFVDQVLPEKRDAHLFLAGPETEGVEDDPEGAETFAELVSARAELPDAERSHVHLVRLPMADDEENSAMVNALQRRADVVLQKSLAEGFGLTVAEAMWKDRPVVASRVGGIQDQIVDGESGILLDDPHDAEGLGRAVTGLFADPARGAAMGTAARRRVCDCFLPDRHFEDEGRVLSRVLD
jgi:trehalose synthase